MESLKVWILAAMVTAWLSVGKIVGITPVDIALAIAQASIEKPLYEGPDGARRTAAMIVAVAVFESGFKQIAGDCKGKPPGWPGCGKAELESAKPTSFCFLQVHYADGVERVKGYTSEEVMKDPLSCARAGREIMRDSIMNKANADEPLRSYAGTSGPARKRWDLARKLFTEVPYTIRCD